MEEHMDSEMKHVIMTQLNMNVQLTVFFKYMNERSNPKTMSGYIKLMNVMISDLCAWSSKLGGSFDQFALKISKKYVDANDIESMMQAYAHLLGVLEVLREICPLEEAKEDVREKAKEISKG